MPKPDSTSETALETLLKARIAASGPIALADYMATCLLHPAHGYYTTRDPLGRAGDFVTAPEISQMFGELIGLWLADMWVKAGREDLVHYVELGPGRGTLAKDVLATTRRYGLEPKVHFVETSLILRDIDLWAELAKRNLAHIGISLTTLDGPLARQLEPRASAPAARLTAMPPMTAPPMYSGTSSRKMVLPVESSSIVCRAVSPERIVPSRLAEGALTAGAGLPSSAGF